MPKRKSKKAVKPPRTADPAQGLRKALARRTKGELIDVLVEFARDDRAVLRRLAAYFELQAPLEELLVMTRHAIGDATAFDERDINYNFSYDDEAYREVQHNLHRLTEMGQLRRAMELSLELMAIGDQTHYDRDCHGPPSRQRMSKSRGAHRGARQHGCSRTATPPPR